MRKPGEVFCKKGSVIQETNAFYLPTLFRDELSCNPCARPTPWPLRPTQLCARALHHCPGQRGRCPNDGHVFSKLKEMSISAINVRADNAGCYHSHGTIASVPHLASESGIHVKSFSFSEAQNGKSSCDHVAAQVKRVFRDFVAARNTVANEEEFYKAITQSGLKGISVYLARIKRGTAEEEKAEIKGLSPQDGRDQAARPLQVRGQEFRPSMALLRDRDWSRIQESEGVHSDDRDPPEWRKGRVQSEQEDRRRSTQEE
ncbi:hypothetical protein PMAYCL1PPCAC_20745 [Pristionchus mayeri]|uniref:Uncharacterized protein n=1 Tax=Pristionchus mayeri TaxID=1317129 RepID=A0AAN5I3W8_9BILA|nr:hypothetical protein PMAYCL1PPCAC_20745 [Pristionchus mayeri]